VIATLSVLQNARGSGRDISLLSDPALTPYFSPLDQNQIRKSFPGGAGVANELWCG